MGGEEPHVTGADARIAGGGSPDDGPDGEGARPRRRSAADLEAGTVRSRMEPGRKRKVREIYDRIDALERSRVKATGKGERAPEIARQLLALREEVRRALEPEAREGSTDVAPEPVRRAQNARSGPKGLSPSSPPKPSRIDKPQGTPDPRLGPRTSPRAVVGETESEGERVGVPVVNG